MKLALQIIRTGFLVEGLLLVPGLPWLAGDRGLLSFTATSFYLFLLGLTALVAGWAMLAGYRWAWKAALVAALGNLPGFPILTLFGAATAALLITPGTRELMTSPRTGSQVPDIGSRWAWGAWPVALATCWLGADWVHQFAVAAGLAPMGAAGSFIALWVGVAGCWYAHEWGHRQAGQSMGLEILAKPFHIGSSWSARVIPHGSVDVPGRLFLYYLGGPLASIGFCALMMAVLLSSPNRFWAPVGEAAGLIGVASLAGFLASIIPWRAVGHYSDGAYLLQLLDAGSRARRIVALSLLRKEIAKGYRPRDWSSDLLRVAVSGRDRSRDYGEGCALNYIHCLDQGYLSSAESWIRQLVDAFSSEPMALAPEWRAEIAYFLAYHSRSGVAREASVWRDAAARSRNCRRLPLLRADAALALSRGDLAATTSMIHLAESLLLRAPFAPRTDFERELWLDLRARAEDMGADGYAKGTKAPASAAGQSSEGGNSQSLVSNVVEMPAMFDPAPQASLE